MKCPYCSYSESKVVDSRPTEENEKIRRRRECLRCLKRFTTYEVIETTPLMVIKKDRSREPFDRAKLIAGMVRACEKRPIGIAQIEQAVSEIETAMQNSLEREISSDRIGEMAMEKLKEIDEVAYVRFASVYREFQDIESFMEELHSLMASKQN